MDIGFDSMQVKSMAPMKEGVIDAETVRYYKLSQVPIMDEFSAGVWKFRDDLEVSTWFVFASRILIDIQDILKGEVGRAWCELKSIVSNSLATLDIEQRDGVMAPRGERWTDRQSQFLHGLHHDLSIMRSEPKQKMKEIWLTTGPGSKFNTNFYHSEEEMEAANPKYFAQQRKNAKSKEDVPPNGPRMSGEQVAHVKSFNLKAIRPAKLPNFVNVLDLILCGFEAFQIFLKMEAGIALANHHLAIFSAAHLYNAARQVGLTNVRWAELDYAIEKHIGPYFAGALPTTEGQIASRYYIQLGFTAKSFSKNKSGSKTTMSKASIRPGMNHGPPISTSKTTTIFREYFSKTKTLQQCLLQAEQLIQESFNSEPKTKSKAMHRKQHQLQLTPMQLLLHFREWSPAAMQELQFDYISMVRTCNRFLRAVKNGIRQLGPEPEYQHRSLPDFLSGADSHDHALNFMVMDILSEMDNTWEAGLEMNRGLKKSEKWELSKGSPQMSVVAEVLENFVERLEEEKKKAKALRQKNLADQIKRDAERSSERISAQDKEYEFPDPMADATVATFGGVPPDVPSTKATHVDDKPDVSGLSMIERLRLGR